MPPNVEPKDYLHALHGITFPASRSQIVGAAKDTGGLNGSVMPVLEQLPDRMYATAEDLAEEIRRTYVPASDSGDAQPAAPSAISNPDKDLIGAMADPRGGDFQPSASPAPTGTTPVEDGNSAG